MVLVVGISKYFSVNFHVVGFEITSSESLQFNLATIEVATNKFSEECKIGRGGYGEVYKVIYECGKYCIIHYLFSFYLSSDDIQF